MTDGPRTEAFFKAYDELLAAAGDPSEREIADGLRGFKIAQTTLWNWKKRVHVPGDDRAFGAVVAFLQRRAGEPVDRQTLEDLRNLARAEVAELKKGGRPGRRPAPDPRRIGVPIADLTDPSAFDVQPGIDAEQHDGLTTYVPRRHDEWLGGRVARAVAGDVVLAFLTGESSVGKTRACWEAIHRLPRGWYLWHPQPDGTDAQRLADVAACTVVWLDEAHDHLGAPEWASALRELTRSPAHGSILVLGTLWPRHYDELTNPDRAGAAVAKQLSGNCAAVSDDVVGADREAMLETGDPRLVEAVRHAQQGRVIQYVAGVPVLLDRYEHAGPIGQALIHAAMDCRRVGYGPVLSSVVLEEAIRGYLPDIHWDAFTDEASPVIWRYLNQPCRGVPGPLTRVRSSAVQSRYRLSPYLEMRSHEFRRRAKIPPELWASLLTHAPREFRVELSRNARLHGLFRTAAEFLDTAAREGDPDAIAEMISLLYFCQRIDDALIWSAEAVRRGSATAALQAASMLAHDNRLDEALRWYRLADESNVDMAWMHAANALAERERFDEALQWLMGAHNRGFGPAAAQIAKLLRRTGRPADAVAWFDRAAAGATDAIECLAKTGDVTGVLTRLHDDRIMRQVDVWKAARSLMLVAGVRAAVRWLRRFPGDRTQLEVQAARLLEESGEVRAAACYFRRAAESGSPFAMLRLAHFAQHEGRHDEAMGLLMRAGREGSSLGQRHAVDAMFEQGRGPEAIEWLRSLKQANLLIPKLALPRALGRAGLIDEAVAECRELAAEGLADAMREATDLLERAGRIGDAAEHAQQRPEDPATLRRAIQEGDHRSRWALARHYESTGQAEKARAVLVEAALHGDIEALCAAATMGADAHTLRNYGIEPDGRASDPWLAPSPA